jgi:SEFIR domain
MAPPASKVFISYSHDSDLHKQRVLLLADRLNDDGLELDCRLDQYVEDQLPADWRGWPNWMRQMIEQADFVLVVCTETYRRRYEGKEEEGRGLGGSWEGAIITQEIYEAHSRNTKIYSGLLPRS